MFASNEIAHPLVARAALPHLSPGGVSVFIPSETVGARLPWAVPYSASMATLEE